MEQDKQLDSLSRTERLLHELEPSIDDLHKQFKTLEDGLIVDPVYRADLANKHNQTERTVQDVRAKLESVKKAATVFFLYEEDDFF
jgi:hypothetical protein